MTEPLLAVVIDAERLAAGLVDPSGDVLVRDRIGTPSREVWRALERLVRRVLAARPDEVPAPVRVGACASGPIDAPAGSVSPTALAAWTAFTLREHLADLTGLPVHLDTFAGAAAEAERWLGDAVGLASFMTLILDHEVESACVIGGTRLRGAHGNAGSLGHLIVDPDGVRCACGGRGCLRTVAAGAALEAEMNRPLRRATASIVERTGLMVGRAIASAASVFDVTTFFVSGSVVDTFGDPLLDTIRREAAARSRLDHLDALSIVEPSGFIQPLVAAAAVARAAHE